MIKIKLPTRVGSMLLSIFGDFDGIQRIGKTTTWLVKWNYLWALSAEGIGNLMRYRQVGPKTVALAAVVISRPRR